ncbi:MAG TPA: hypothetical protein VFQ30_04190 [Ktedonobacteraceae bacterium]|nr:hypothetical protein [Ktedonobacteraceae bacterium]
MHEMILLLRALHVRLMWTPRHPTLTSRCESGSSPPSPISLSYLRISYSAISGNSTPTICMVPARTGGGTIQRGMPIKRCGQEALLIEDHRPVRSVIHAHVGPRWHDLARLPQGYLALLTPKMFCSRLA